MNKRIYLCLAHMSGKEQMYIKEAFDTKLGCALGPNVNGFEKDLEEFVGEGKHVVALSAGTAAVHLALLACGVKRGMRCWCRVLLSVLPRIRSLIWGLHLCSWIRRWILGIWILRCWKRLLKIVSRRRENTESDCPGGLIWDAL